MLGSMPSAEFMPAIGDESEKMKLVWICIIAAGRPHIPCLLCVQNNPTFGLWWNKTGTVMSSSWLTQLLPAGTPFLCLVGGLIYRYPCLPPSTVLLLHLVVTNRGPNAGRVLTTFPRGLTAARGGQLGRERVLYCHPTGPNPRNPNSLISTFLDRAATSSSGRTRRTRSRLLSRALSWPMPPVCLRGWVLMLGS